MTCALGRARPGPGMHAQATFLITLLTDTEFKLWDSFAQNKTSEISKIGLSGILGLLCAVQHVGNFKNARSEILELLGAEPNVGNLQKHTFSDNSGAPVRRTKRRKSQNMHFQKFCGSCTQNKTPKISKLALAEILGFLCAEQNVGNVNR